MADVGKNNVKFLLISEVVQILLIRGLLKFVLVCAVGLILYSVAIISGILSIL